MNRPILKEYVTRTLCKVSGESSQKTLPLPSRSDFVGSLAAYVIDPYSLTKYKDLKRALESNSRLRQITVGMLMYLTDNDDVFKLTPETAQKEPRPYLKNDKLWSYPGDTSGETAYSFNKNLTNVRYGTIKRPDKVVLFYQGSAGKLKSIKGKASVAFMDCTIKTITPNQEKHLIWKH